MNKIRKKSLNAGSQVFNFINYTLLICFAVVCLLPIINVLSVSFSSSAKATAGLVKLWPLDFTWASYQYALTNPQFIVSFLISLKRVGLGLVINMAFTVLAAYPLSQSAKDFRGRMFFAWFFFFTTLFGGGLIPTYLVVRNTHLLNTVWALILPGAVPVFNVIVLLNFFRQLPKELSESAFIDGAGHGIILTRIYLPLSIPSLATLILFTAVGHWNSWFDGLIYMSDYRNYPLQTYLQSLQVQTNSESLIHATTEQLKQLTRISDRTLKDAQIFIAALPILAIYPFLQRYFMKGLVLGSVKG
jgi:putative aldouronate transport system permease protein